MEKRTSHFSHGTIAEVIDLYTGKSFIAKRTMGTNHADAEALTKKDTDIIKKIWGSFSCGVLRLGSSGSDFMEVKVTLNMKSWKEIYRV